MLCHYGCGKEATKQLKNGNWICSNSPNQCPVIKEKNSRSLKENYCTAPAMKASLLLKESCTFCLKVLTKANLKIHENTCYLNPTNMKLCPECDGPIKDYKHTATCSSKCARSHFSEMYAEFGRNNGMRGEDSYV